MKTNANKFFRNFDKVNEYNLAELSANSLLGRFKDIIKDPHGIVDAKKCSTSILIKSILEWQEILSGKAKERKIDLPISLNTDLDDFIVLLSSCEKLKEDIVYNYSDSERFLFYKKALQSGRLRQELECEKITSKVLEDDVFQGLLRRASKDDKIYKKCLNELLTYSIASGVIDEIKVFLKIGANTNKILLDDVLDININNFSSLNSFDSVNCINICKKLKIKNKKGMDSCFRSGRIASVLLLNYYGCDFSKDFKKLESFTKVKNNLILGYDGLDFGSLNKEAFINKSLSIIEKRILNDTIDISKSVLKNKARL